MRTQRQLTRTLTLDGVSYCQLSPHPSLSANWLILNRSNTCKETMNPSNYRSNEIESLGSAFKKKLAVAKASHSKSTSSHVINGTLTLQPNHHAIIDVHGNEQPCTVYDMYASWDNEKLIHLVHTIGPFEKQDKKFPSAKAKPLIFIGCFLEADIEEIHPITAKLSFTKEKATHMLKVGGDLLMYFDHFELSGEAVPTRVKGTYQLELRALPEHGVGG